MLFVCLFYLKFILLELEDKEEREEREERGSVRGSVRRGGRGRSVRAIRMR
jgi:hypothetical protein